jgi:hypothetical protein
MMVLGGALFKGVGKGADVLNEKYSDLKYLQTQGLLYDPQTVREIMGNQNTAGLMKDVVTSLQNKVIEAKNQGIDITPDKAKEIVDQVNEETLLNTKIRKTIVPESIKSEKFIENVSRTPETYLLQEAQKYKSADGFVNDLEDGFVLHGTDNLKNANSIIKNGFKGGDIYVTKDFKTATEQGGNNIVSALIKKGAKPFEKSDISDIYDRYNPNDLIPLPKNIKSTLDLEDYLTDIWNKSKSSETSITSEIQDKANLDWEENYSERVGNLNLHAGQLQQQLKNASKSDGIVIQKQIDEINSEIAKLENEFVNKWNGKVQQENKQMTPEEEENNAYIAGQKLVDKAIKNKKAVILDPDELKSITGNPNTKNHPVYSRAVIKLYLEALKKTESKIVKFTAGGSGSGKTDFVTSIISQDFDGIIMDGTLANYDHFVDRMNDAISAGKTEIQVSGVITDIERAWKYAIEREKETGRGIPLDAFLDRHIGAANTMLKILENNPEVILNLKDTRAISDFNLAKNIDFITDRNTVIDILRSLNYNKNKLLNQLQKYDRNSTENVTTKNRLGEQPLTESKRTETPGSFGRNEPNSQTTETLKSNVDLSKENRPDQVSQNQTQESNAGDKQADFVIPEQPKSPSGLPTIKPITVKPETKISELSLQVEELGASLDGNPLKQLTKYESKRYPGELPEVTGEKGTNIFKQKGDQIAAEVAAEMGHPDWGVEEVSQAFSKYAESRDALKELQAELKKAKGESFTDYTDAQINKINDLFQLANDGLEATKSKLEPIAGTGEIKTRGLARGIEEKAVKNKLIKELGDLPEYRSINMEDQAKMASDLVNSDYERAKSISMGQESAPKGLMPESVFVAVEERATREGDFETIRDLGTRSTLIEESTTMGQRLRALAERDPDSAVSRIKDVSRARKKSVESKMRGKSPDQIKSELKNSLKEKMTKAKPSKYSWNTFLEEIKC